eukprot:14656-Heterococcus_DN1.PRE.4
MLYSSTCAAAEFDALQDVPTQHPAEGRAQCSMQPLLAVHNCRTLISRSELTLTAHCIAKHSLSEVAQYC